MNEVSGRFDVKELAQASGLTVGNIRMLMDREPGTLTTEQAMPGRGVSRTFPIVSLKRAALISAVAKTGVGVSQAARIAGEFAMDFEMSHGGLHANMDAFISRADLSKIYDIGYGKEDHYGNDWEFYAYMILGHTPGHEKRNGDMIMEVIDQTYVFMDIVRDKPMRILGGPKMDAVFRIEGWERGGDLSISHLSESGTSQEEWEAEAEKWQSFRENFVTKISLNVSLIIRDAFERIRLARAV